jgi:hypothetical protein
MITAPAAIEATATEANPVTAPATTPRSGGHPGGDGDLVGGGDHLA